MKERDLNKIAKIEQAIKKKYGEDAIQNPKSLWDEEKEKKYLKQLKSFHEKSSRNSPEKDLGSFKFKDNKASPPCSRICEVCDVFSFSADDDLYMVKYECCFECYIQFVEDREERWKSGWRPNN